MVGCAERRELGRAQVSTSTDAGDLEQPARGKCRARAIRIRGGEGENAVICRSEGEEKVLALPSKLLCLSIQRITRPVGEERVHCGRGWERTFAHAQKVHAIKRESG